MYVTPPWEPTAIELTTANREYWWQVGEATERPERWTVRAEVAAAENCPPDVRHVGVIELAVAELTEDGLLLNPATAGPWARDFLAAAVADLDRGALVPELERVIAPGPARMVILRRLYLHDAWRGCGLSAALLSAALHRFAAMARLAACRIQPADMPELVPGMTGTTAESAARHAGRLLARTGFFPWRDVHLVGLHDGQSCDQLAAEAAGAELEDALEDMLSRDADDEPGRDRP